MKTKNVTRGFGLLEEFLSLQRFKQASRLLPHNLRKGRLLDIGCGSYPLNLIKMDFKEKYGLDKVVSQKLQEELKKTYNINLLQHNIEEETPLPFENNYFDAITMLAVLEHIEPERLVPLIKEIHRILKKDGHFIITVPAAWTDKILRLLAKLHLVSSIEIEEHKDQYTHKKVVSILQKAGFSQNNIKYGYFELFMNLWIKAIK